MFVLVAVYHFSDVPSFVSSDSIVIFDPHIAYLPGTTLSQPGLKIRFVKDDNSSVRDQFPDQVGLQSTVCSHGF